MYMYIGLSEITDNSFQYCISWSIIVEGQLTVTFIVNWIGKGHHTCMYLLSYIYSGTLLEQTQLGSTTSSKVSLARGLVVDHTPLKILPKTINNIVCATYLGFIATVGC